MVTFHLTNGKPARLILQAAPSVRLRGRKSAAFTSYWLDGRASSLLPICLVECRQALEDTLDREQLGWHGLIREWLPFLHLPPRWAAPRIAFALSLVVFSFGLGWTLRPRAAKVIPSEPGGMTSSSLAGADFENMRINDISGVTPDPKTGDVRITMDAQRRVTLEGSLDDPHIQQLLVYAVKSYDNAGIRRDTLDALRPGPTALTSEQPCSTPWSTTRTWQSRLAALDAVRGMEGGEDLQQSLIEVLDAACGRLLPRRGVLARGRLARPRPISSAAWSRRRSTPGPPR